MSLFSIFSSPISITSPFLDILCTFISYFYLLPFLTKQPLHLPHNTPYTNATFSNRYYKNPQGFEQAMVMWQNFGRDVFKEKWGHQGCDIRGVGLGKGDEWRVEHDWDRPVEGV